MVYNKSMNTETVKIPATAVRVGTVLADGATVAYVSSSAMLFRGSRYYRIMVTLPGGTLRHTRMINVAGTQTVTKP